MSRAVLGLYPLLLLGLVWEAVARLGLVRPLFLPPLTTTLATLPRLWTNGDLAGPLAISLYRAVCGMAVAAVVALPLGFAMARLRWARRLFSPLIALGAAAPKIAFLPVFIVWFGIGHASKIGLVALTTVFPFIMATLAGIESVAPAQIWAARAMGTPSLTLFRRVLLPASLPSLMSGVRVAIPYALVTAFTAEMVGGGGGLGSSLVVAQRYFESPTVFADIIVMCGVGYIVDFAIARLRRHVLRWHE